jgi:D-alanyl-D-alanine carboxypeptidase (penicillin-binding protein 5/6)
MNRFSANGIRIVCLFMGMPSMMGIAAESHLVVEFSGGMVLEAKNEKQPTPVASLTKIASALIALEWCEEQSIDSAKWSFLVPSAAIRGGANPLGLKAGDQLSLETGLFAAMMASDNTSTHAFAEAMGRQMVPGTAPGKGVLVFVERMNALAARLGMNDTHFVNPHGLDEGSEKGLSTAADLGRLALAAIKRPRFLDYASAPERTVSFLREGQSVSVKLTNTNELVGSRGIDGMKTGTTRLSGPCLIATATRDLAIDGITAPRRLVVVLLDAEDRFREAVLLLDQGWSALASGRESDPKQRLRKETD